MSPAPVAPDRSRTTARRPDRTARRCRVARAPNLRYCPDDRGSTGSEEPMADTTSTPHRFNLLTKNLPAPQVRDLPEPPTNTWRIVGPGMVGAGVGLASGEFILWPYISSQVGLVFLWGAVVGVAIQWFLNMEIERYTLATGETALTGFNRYGKHWGLFFAIMTYFANLWPGWATSSAAMLTYLFGAGDPTLDRDRDPGRDRPDPDARAGGLRDARAADLREDRGGRAARRTGADLRDPRQDLQRARRGRHRAGVPGRPARLRADDGRDRVRRGRRRAEPVPEQLDPGQGLRDGPARAAADVTGDR